MRQGRAVRWVRAVCAAALLLAVVVGAPVLLLQWGSPAALLSVDWAVVLSRPADPRLIIGLLSIVGWVAWLVLTLTITFEVLAVASRHRIRLALPGTAWLRPAMGALVAAALAVPSVAQAAPPEPGQPSPAPTATATTRSDTPDERANASPQPDSRQYQVRPGDELWTIAEEQLGSGARWREIVALNPDIDDSLKVRPGQSLRLPLAATPPDDAGAMVVVVQRGDSLWSIAERVLGDGERWPEIFDLNRDQIADPDEIDIGWVLALPSPSEPAQAPPRPSSAGAHGEADASGVVGSAEVRPGLPTPPPVPPRDAERPSELGTEEAGTAERGTKEVEATDSGTEKADTEHGTERVETTERGVDPAVALGALGSLLAVGVLGGLAARRRAQLHARPVGRRLTPMTPQVSRLWAALSHDDAPTGTDHGRGPTQVLFGWESDGAEVWLDLEQDRATILTGTESAGSLATALTSLSSAPWSQPVEVVCVGGHDWPGAVDEPRIDEEPDPDAALIRLTRLCSTRRLALREQTLESVRSDADLAPQWAPTVFVFEAPLSPADLDRVSDALALGRVGVSVLARAEAAPHIDATHLDIGAGSATFAGRAEPALPFTPQLIAAPARRALIDLLRATGSSSTEPAPWWQDTDDLPPNVLPLPRFAAHAQEQPMPDPPEDNDHPTLLLLGEVALLDPAGSPPNRALSQCMEYCAWLLSHAGATASEMVSSLLVAETTRRSNMSRLRSWLGTAPDGGAYLPDAYSGRIRLDPRVTSDWERFEALLAGGVNLASTAALRQALRLVRGEPLGPLAFQWHWAETMRADMVAMIVDAASVLADRAIDQRDPDQALWAVARGRLAAPEDDELSVREIHALAIAGRRSDLERAVVALNRTVRAANRDLPQGLARRVQLAIHLSTPRASAEAE